MNLQHLDAVVVAEKPHHVITALCNSLSLRSREAIIRWSSSAVMYDKTRALITNSRLLRKSKYKVVWCRSPIRSCGLFHRNRKHVKRIKQFVPIELTCGKIEDRFHLDIDFAQLVLAGWSGSDVAFLSKWVFEGDSQKINNLIYLLSILCNLFFRGTG